jgi:hypothetical protein
MAVHLWNEFARGHWRNLNRTCKKRADRRVSAFAARQRGGVLGYQWELQQRGVWHLHLILGVQTFVERAWANEYGRALRELAERYGFGHVDLRPLTSGKRYAGLAAGGYIAKYLLKRDPATGRTVVSETVTTAGRSMLNYTARRLTSATGCTMLRLRRARHLWAWRSGRCDRPSWANGPELELVVRLLDGPSLGARAP